MDRYTYIISSPTCGKCTDLDTLLTRRGVPHEKLDAESEKGRMLVDRHGLEHVGTMVMEENGATRVITMRDINELYPK
ncbi:MAG: hypothetical protein Q4B48_00540 [Syntrophomonadaceae bacterium]|nr:hypothetical protein [Syntrophomonadaceae bacterium]